MILTEETPVPLAALPVAHFRDHLRLSTGFADDTLQDDLLEGFLRAALTAIERRISKALFQRSFVWELSDWTSQSAAALPLAPVSDLTSVNLVDAQGTELALPLDGYFLERDDHRPILRSRSGGLPTLASGTSVRLRFVAGYGPAWADLPADLTQAVLLLAAHYYEFRSETALSDGCMPFGVTALIERYRPFRLMGRL